MNVLQRFGLNRRKCARNQNTPTLFVDVDQQGTPSDGIATKVQFLLGTLRINTITFCYAIKQERKGPSHSLHYTHHVCLSLQLLQHHFRVIHTVLHLYSHAPSMPNRNSTEYLTVPEQHVARL